jgi:O-antigen/teichoic acid export membrane protein
MGGTPGIHHEELTQIAKGAGINITGKVVGSAIQYAYSLVIARVLQADAFGIFMLGFTIMSIGGAIGRLGLENGAIKFISQYNGIGDKARVKGVIVQALKYSFIASILIGAILFLTARFMSNVIFNELELEWVLKIFSLALPFYSLMIISLSCTRGFKIMKYAVYTQNLFLHTFNLILVGIFVFLGMKLYGVASAYMITLFITATLSIYFLLKTFPEIWHTKTITQSKKLFRFSIPLLLVFIVNMIIMWTDTLMLGYFKTSREVGIYSAALRTAMFITTFLISFNSIFAPVISDLHNRRETKKLESLFKTVSKWIYMASLPLFLLLVLLPKEVMSMFGPEFIAGSVPLIILAFANVTNSGTGCVGYMIIMSGKQDLMMYNSLGVCFLNIILNYLLIPSYGIIGASIASGVSLAVYAIVLLIEVYVLLKIHPYNIMFLKITFLGLLLYGIFSMLKYTVPDLTGVLRVLFFVPVFLSFYVWLIYKWGTDDDDRIVIGFLKGRLLKTMA